MHLVVAAVLSRWTSFSVREFSLVVFICIGIRIVASTLGPVFFFRVIGLRNWIGSLSGSPNNGCNPCATISTVGTLPPYTVGM